ncbi:hypothetical protein HK098_007771 [Nowakowskiella sp. JEL0407]|nr:hypothetical protein HK098_007771 [Nowakowskiella sp. JEL0407]
MSTSNSPSPETSNVASPSENLEEISVSAELEDLMEPKTSTSTDKGKKKVTSILPDDSEDMKLSPVISEATLQEEPSIRERSILEADIGEKPPDDNASQSSSLPVTTIVITPSTTTVSTSKDGKVTTQTTTRKVLTTTTATIDVSAIASTSGTPADPEKEPWNPHTQPLQTLNLQGVSAEDAAIIAELLANEVADDGQPIGNPPRYHTIAYDAAYHRQLFLLYRGRLRRTYLWPIFVPTAAIVLMFFASPPQNRLYTLIPLGLWTIILIIMFIVYRRKSIRLERVYKLGLLATIPFSELNSVVLYNSPISDAPTYDETAIRFDDPLPLYPPRRGSLRSVQSRVSARSRIGEFFGVRGNEPPMPTEDARVAHYRAGSSDDAATQSRSNDASTSLTGARQSA